MMRTCYFLLVLIFLFFDRTGTISRRSGLRHMLIPSSVTRKNRDRMDRDKAERRIHRERQSAQRQSRTDTTETKSDREVHGGAAANVSISYVMWSDKPTDWKPLNHSCDPNTWFVGLNQVKRKEER